MKAVNAVKCDCLNRCGDDPWLATGRAQPCERKVRDDRQREQLADRAARIVELRRALGCVDELDALENLAAARAHLAQFVAANPGC